jgi:NAD(P)-dependent dehydrogenase (short-subunit alcohol dehydrogenase family)
MDITMNGKVALITGASKGIGAATARHLAGCGAKVALLARSADALEALAREIDGAQGAGTALALPCDVADWQAVSGAVARTVETFGGLDIAVNNAGLIDPIAMLEDTDPLAWGNVIDVNVKGVYHVIRAAIPPMKARGGGVVVNISSGAATSNLEGWAHYSASKAAVLSLTDSANRELKPHGIHVVGLSPGTVATDMQHAIKASGINPVSELDWDRHIPPEWVARAIVWLTTDAARQHDGGDFSIKTEEGRRAVGLV